MPNHTPDQNVPCSVDGLSALGRKIGELNTELEQLNKLDRDADGAKALAKEQIDGWLEKARDLVSIHSVTSSRGDGRLHIHPRHDGDRFLWLLLLANGDRLHSLYANLLDDHYKKNPVISAAERTAESQRLKSELVKAEITYEYARRQAKCESLEVPDRADANPRIRLAKMNLNDLPPDPESLEIDPHQLLDVLSEVSRLEAIADAAGEFAADLSERLIDVRDRLAERSRELNRYEFDRKSSRSQEHKAKLENEISRLQAEVEQLETQYDAACESADRSDATAQAAQKLKHECTKFASARGVSNPFPPQHDAKVTRKGR